MKHRKSSFSKEYVEIADSYNEQNDDHKRIVHKIRFRSSFNWGSFLKIEESCISI